MKKERSLAGRAKAEHDLLWDLVKMILLREKEFHGPTMVQGRDGGNACIKKQLAAHKLIRSPTPDAVKSEFTKLYNVKIKKSSNKPTKDLARYLVFFMPFFKHVFLKKIISIS